MFNDDSLDISKQEAQIILNDYFDMLQQNILNQQWLENKALLESSNSNEVTLASGLKIVMIDDLEGENPSILDSVSVECVVKSMDGEIINEFEEPQTFTLSANFILTEGIQYKFAIGLMCNTVVKIC